MASRLSINSVSAIANAIERGGGTHLGPLWLFVPLERQGDVRRTLPSSSAPRYAPHAVRNYARRPPAKVRHFVEHVAAELPSLDGLHR